MWVRDFIIDLVKSFCINVMKCGPIPRHVAFIMDGNRRYAKQYKMPVKEGHLQGYQQLFQLVDICLNFGIKEATAYAFSIENFKRSKTEVKGLLDLFREKYLSLVQQEEKLREKGIQIKIIGNTELCPKDLKILISKLESLTNRNNRFCLNIAFAYTSREEITNAVKTVVAGAVDGSLKMEDISEHLLSECMYTRGSSDPDLLIRSSGEVRLSDFLLWQTTSTCFYFTPVLWPEFNFWTFLKALFYYQRCFKKLKILKEDLKEDTDMNCNNLNGFLDKLDRRNSKAGI